MLFVQDRICSRSWKEASALREAGVSVDLVELRESSSFRDYSVFDDHVNLPVDPGIRSMALNGRRVRSMVADHLRSRSYDLVQTHNGPDALGAWLPRITSAPVVHDIHDLQTESELPWAGPVKTLAVRTLHRWWEGTACRSATAVMTTSPAMARYVRRKYGRDEVFALENKVLPFSFDPLPKLSESEGGIHLVYAGGIRPGEGTERDLIPVFEQIAGGDIHVHVYPILPDGAEGEQARDALDRATNVHAHDLVPQDRFVEEMSQYDWGIVWFTRFNENIRVAAPNKLYEFQVAGLPIVTNVRDGHIGDHVRKRSAGIVVGRADQVPERVEDPPKIDLDPEGCFLKGQEIVRIYEQVLERA